MHNSHVFLSCMLFVRLQNLFCLFQKSTLLYTWDRAFAHAAPVLWNSLPLTIRTSSSLAIFKKQLKTFLLRKLLICWNSSYGFYLMKLHFVKAMFLWNQNLNTTMIPGVKLACKKILSYSTHFTFPLSLNLLPGTSVSVSSRDSHSRIDTCISSNSF